MKISDDFVLVKKFEEPKAEGFQAVEIQDSFVYKGVVVQVPARPVYLGNDAVTLGQTILFAKYSPDTVEMHINGELNKFVKTTDILAVL